jgi:hypothetical protein
VPRLPKFPVAQEQRQAVMEGISRHLRGVLTAQQPREVVESVRRCEYELLLRAAHFQEYTDEASLPARLVAVINITTVEDLNHKIQQYEMGLIISSNSLEEYMDKGTLPKRLASLVTDFTEYKKTLTPQQLSS